MGRVKWKVNRWSLPELWRSPKFVPATFPGIPWENKSAQQNVLGTARENRKQKGPPWWYLDYHRRSWETAINSMIFVILNLWWCRDHLFIIRGYSFIRGPRTLALLARALEGSSIAGIYVHIRRKCCWISLSNRGWSILATRDFSLPLLLYTPPLGS